jgi:hypothetical protein
VGGCSSKWLGRTDLNFTVLKKVVVDNAFNEGYFNSIVNLVNSSAVMTKEYSMVDAYIYLLEDL